MQKQQLVRALGLLWKRVDKITSLDTKIDNEALAFSGENNRTIGRPKVNQSINSLMNEWIN